MESERSRQVDAIVRSALARDPTQREEYLRESSGGDELLFQEATASLQRVLAAQALEREQVTAAGALRGEAGSASSGRIGWTVSHYLILDKLGEGGMGVVYKARDLKLDRLVALKFLASPFGAAGPEKVRFVHEARAASALDHPNIGTIYEIEDPEDGPMFIAMAYYEGETLKEKLDRGHLPVEEAITYATQIAEGLSAAHEAGIVHRDIKPANIVITTRGQAKILDFGLAKVAEQTKITQTGSTLGTAAYMSPEQASGEVVDHRTDLWSLGVVFYEMLTGRPPFEAEYRLAMAYAILNQQHQEVGLARPDAPEQLGPIIDRLLAKSPSSRYSTATEVLTDLRAISDVLAGRQDGMSHPPARSRRRWGRAYRAGTAAVVVVLAALGAWFLHRQSQIRWARTEAIPGIRRLVDENDVWRNLVPAFRLAEEAEVILGEEDEALAELFSQVSLRIDVLSEPPGAGVYMKEYGDPEAEWAYLGVTPLKAARVPIGIFRWRLEKEGYETVLAAASTWNTGGSVGGKSGVVIPHALVRKLDPVGSLPEGMVRVPATGVPQGQLDDFFVGRYEVTNREFRAFVDAGGYRRREFWEHPFQMEDRVLTWEEAMASFVDASGQPGPATWLGGDVPEGQADYPVSGVSWYEAAAFAEFAGKSLPTSAHWDVARGAQTPMIRVYQLGGFAVLAPFSNFGRQGPVAVGSLPGITAYGAYDMAGNVREWCWNETPVGRVIRGGAWEDNTYEFGNVRQAPPMDRSPRNGIRLAFYPQPEAIPAGMFALQEPVDPVDARALQPVSESIFNVYREQFGYDPAELNALVEDRQVSPGGWTRERVSFDAAYGGERVLAYLFLPANVTPPYQAVIYFPGSAVLRTPSSEDLESYYEFPLFLSFLVKNGRAVLFPVYKGTFERSELELPRRPDESRGFAEHQVQLVKDVRRSIDYLESRPEIDSSKLAFYGMSWGGQMGAIVPAVEKRFAASVLVAGGLGGMRTRAEANPINYVTRIRVPTLMLNGRYDTGIDTRIRPMFDLLGTPPEHKRFILYETDHIPPRAEYIKETLAWLDTYLGSVRN